MPKLSGRVLWSIVVALLAVQSTLIVLFIHRASPTFDEGNHSFAAYMMLHTGDYGLNPEHPPLVKFLAALRRHRNPGGPCNLRLRFDPRCQCTYDDHRSNILEEI